MRRTYFEPAKNTAMPSQVFNPDISSSATTRAWEKFIEGGQTDGEMQKTVRSEILESWIRCTDSGISALAVATPQKVEQEDVYELRQNNRSLCWAARAAFGRLAPHLTDSGAILILTDKNGTVIDAIGDPQTLDLGREIQLEVGGVWDESVIGTNGIGTALRTGKPTYVHASEHFCQGIQSWTCAGVPIFDPLDRTIMGVIDLSGPPAIFQPHNVALVIATAREIEIALAELQREERTKLLEAYIDLPKAHNSDESVVLLNDSGRIVYSRNTDGTSGLSQNYLPIGSRLLELNPGITDGDIAAALPPNLTAEAVKILKSGNKIQGAALILPGNKTHTARLKSKGITIKSRAGIQEDELTIIGESSKMLEAVEFARRAAAANVTVLIQGETGVGKELFARLIHHHKPSKNPPYVAVNCAAISGELIGGELFGHVSGAFTGALREGKTGKFEHANGGILCLDEVGDMPPELQTYLLRTLEQRAVYRIGCNIRRSLNVQLIAITNRNLRQDIEAGRFRRDLFYRISTIVIDVPPLRERGKDIDLLIEHFNHSLSKRFERQLLDFTPEAIAMLRNYDWPGNVRELRNMMERLCLLHQNNVVTTEDLPDDICKPESVDFLAGGPVATTFKRMNLDGIESIAIQRAIDQENGNLSKAASSLGISRPTLYRKIRLYNLARGKP